MTDCKRCGSPIYSIVHFVDGEPFHEPCANMARNEKKYETANDNDVALENNESIKGTIKWFNNKKAYGFITDPDGNDYFFHISNVRGAKLPSTGDFVKFNSCEGKKGKLAANDIEIITKRSGDNRRPYYGKNVQRTEVVEHGSTKGGAVVGLGVIGTIVGGPIGGIIGAVIGGVIGEDKDEVTKQVDIASPCIRCGGKGHATSRVDERTGFQCSRCRHFWTVSDSKLPLKDLSVLKEIDFTKR